MDRFLAVGKAAARTEGPEKVAGKATYAADKMFPRIVWGKAVRSGFPHARIVSIDTSKAKAYPGVLAVIAGEDVPDILTGRQLQDTPILARDRVRFIGEKVAVVGAESREIAEEAAMLIDVEYEEWPAVFDPIAAMRQGASLLQQEMASYGNLPKPMAEIPNVHSHVQWLVDAGPLRQVDLFRQKLSTLQPIPPRIVVHGAVLENQISGEDIDLLKFPVPLIHEQDGGRFIGTASIAVTRDRDEGWVNLGTYRSMVHDSKKIGSFYFLGF